MEFPWMKNSPPFHYMLRASGQSEVWHDFTNESKFHQYGWRCSTSEDAYSTATLIGNWSEQRFDSRRSMAVQRPLPSQFSHYFETTYASAFNKDEKRPVYCVRKREPRGFPGHQPELDHPHTKCVPNSCYRLDFRVPGQGTSRRRETAATQQTGVGDPNSSLMTEESCLSSPSQ